MQRAGLPHLSDVPGRYLSAGQKRRVNLARLGLAPAPLWLLDEPTTALDRAAVARFAGEIARHRAAGGIVVLSTHVDLDLADSARLDVSRFHRPPDLDIDADDTAPADGLPPPIGPGDGPVDVDPASRVRP